MDTINKQKRHEIKPAVRALACIGAAILVYAAVCLTCGSYYATNDDPAIANISAGAFGEQSEMLIYVNVLLGLLFKALYKIAFLPWFYIISILLVILALGTIGFVITDRIKGACGVLVYAALLLTVGVDLFALVTYTKNAVLIISAGLLLIIWSRGKKGVAAWLGVLLFAVGSLVRFNVVIPSLGVFLPAIALMFVRKGNQRAKTRAVACLFVGLVLVMGCHLYDTAYYENDEDWQGFTEYNAARTDFVDYKLTFAGKYGGIYDYYDLGISKTEYDLIRTWNANDPDYFTAELFRELSDATVKPTLMQNIRDYFATFADIAFRNVHYVALILCGVIVFISLHGFEKLFAAATVLFAFGGMGLLSFIGRLIDRSEEAIVMASCCALLAMLPSAVKSPAEETAGSHKPHAMMPEMRSKIISWVAVAAIVAAVPYAVVAKNTNIDAKGRGASSRWVVETISENKQYLYLLGSEYIDAIHGREVLNTLEPGALDNVVFLGSWMSQSGFEKQTLARFGETNAFAAIAHNPNARMYINLYIQDTVNYIYLHYGVGPDLITNSDGSYSYDLSAVGN